MKQFIVGTTPFWAAIAVIFVFIQPVASNWMFEALIAEPFDYDHYARVTSFAIALCLLPLVLGGYLSFRFAIWLDERTLVKEAQAQ